MLENDSEIAKKIPELEEVMRNIKRYCNTGEEDNAVLLFKDIGLNSAEKDKLAANTVWDALMLTLSSIAEYSYQIARDPARLNSKNYEFVLRQVETIAGVCRSLTENLVPLTKNEKLEMKHAKLGDMISAYYAENITLGSSKYRMIRILVRPKKYVMPIEIKNNRQPINVAETAQARMKIDLIPEDNPDNSVSIRTDREDWQHGYEITFDVDIFRESNNLMDNLSFSDGQRDGHHFSSSLTAEEFEVTFTQILTAFNKKFESMVE